MAVMSLNVGDIVEGKVNNITKFGVFVELADRKVGLVHISEVANNYVANIKDFINEADNVKVRVLSIDGNGKIALSIKQAQPVQEKKEKVLSKPLVTESFEDRLGKFMKNSDERLIELKRHTESKRGGRGASRR